MMTRILETNQMWMSHLIVQLYDDINQITMYKLSDEITKVLSSSMGWLFSYMIHDKNKTCMEFLYYNSPCMLTYFLYNDIYDSCQNSNIIHVIILFLHLWEYYVHKNIYRFLYLLSCLM